MANDSTKKGRATATRYIVRLRKGTSDLIYARSVGHVEVTAILHLKSEYR